MYQSPKPQTLNLELYTLTLNQYIMIPFNAKTLNPELLNHNLEPNKSSTHNSQLIYPLTPGVISSKLNCKPSTPNPSTLLTKRNKIRNPTPQVHAPRRAAIRQEETSGLLVRAACRPITARCGWRSPITGRRGWPRPTTA